MKILWTHNFDPNNMNAGNFMFSCAKTLQDQGVELDLYYLGNLRSVSNLIKVRKHVQSIANGYDIIHAQFGSACAMATSSVKGVPKVLSLRGSDWYRFDKKVNFAFAHGLLATFMTKLSISKFNAIFTVSERMSNDVGRQYPSSKRYTIPSPINLSNFKPMDKQESRKALGFENNNDYWVLFTTLRTTNPIKRAALAKEAVEIASRQMGGGVKMRIATEIPHDQMPIFVSSCDIVLCTSTHEGWPNCIKEALACNIPFVSTDVSDLHLIADKEKNCRVCPPDPQIIADNICDVLMQSNNHDLGRYVSSMGLEKTCKKILNVYNEILST
jgi:teichuronic acid biosynthesis glycosyltransferase TuaC